MAVQVSHPGVYISEFTPAAPIEGVSTSHAAFIGLAEKGPIGQPTLVTSLDDFTRIFGAPVDGTVRYYLPISAEGFYRNGGSVLYVVRIGTAKNATNFFKCRKAPKVKLLTATARAEGSPGEGITITASDSSTLEKKLAALAPPAGPKLKAANPPAKATALDATRRILTVDTSKGFTPGDRVAVDDGGTKRTATVLEIPDATTITLASALSGGPAALAANAPVTLDDLAVGDKLIRLEVPNGLNLRQALPAGTIVSITGAPGAVDMCKVGEVTADAITLATPLTKNHKRATAEVGSAEFDLVITTTGGAVETFEELSTSSNHPRYWQTVVADSALATFTREDPLPPGANPDPRPEAATIVLAGSVDDDPGSAWADLPNTINTHLGALGRIDDISLVAVPGNTDNGVQKALVSHCETLFDRFAILDGVLNADLTQLRAQRAGLTGELDLGFGALYAPWIQLRDTAKKAVVDHPPSGHLAGIYAKIDTTRGVHVAPANVGIATALGLTQRFSDADQGFVNLDGVNLIRILPGRGSPVVWGARTTTGDRNWQYVNIRRLFLFLEESIQEGLRPSVFAPNDLALWERLKRTLTEFLTRVWRDGALFGATAKEAFYVRIDEALNPPSTRKLGRLYIEIGVQPVYPAEFIVVRIGIWDGGGEVSES